MDLNIIAKNPHISVSSRKLGDVVRLINGMSVVRATNLLELSHKACALDVLSLIKSAMHNALNNFGCEDPTNLYIKEIRLGRGKFLKRFHARARGRSSKILKHSSNLAIILGVRSVL